MSKLIAALSRSRTRDVVRSYSAARAASSFVKDRVVRRPLSFTVHFEKLLALTYEPFARPINCTTHTFTAQTAQDRTHPQYIIVNRRLKAFDKNVLHYRVQCPVDVVKRAFIRGWASRRVKNAFVHALKERGFDKDGRPIPAPGDVAAPSGNSMPSGLSGAAVITLKKNDEALTSSKEDVRRAAAWLVQNLIRLQTNARNRARSQSSPFANISYHASARGQSGSTPLHEQVER